MDSSNAKLRIKNYSLYQLDRGLDGGLRKMGGEKEQLFINEIEVFIAFLRPIFDSLEATYHNKKISLIFGYFALHSISLTKIDVSPGKVEKYPSAKSPIV